MCVCVCGVCVRACASVCLCMPVCVRVYECVFMLVWGSREWVNSLSMCILSPYIELCHSMEPSLEEML